MAFEIAISVERSNPLIFRQVLVPDGLTCGDLLTVSRIATGLEPGKGKLFRGLEELGKKEARLSEMLHEGDELRIWLSEGTKHYGKGRELSLYLLVKKEVPLSGDASSEEIPRVLLSEGRNLPPGVGEIGEVNRIQKALNGASSVQSASGEFLTEKSLEFSPKKTDNAMRRQFAPETARKELDMRLALPMRLLLDKLKLNDLKDMANEQDMYYYGQPRKAELVDSFCRRYDERYIQDFFEILSIAEFQEFKRFAQGDAPEMPDVRFMPSFQNRGFLLDVPKVGIRIASELLEYYDGWYDTESETAFLHRKTIRSAMLASARLYGIFSREQFLNVVERLSGGLDLNSEAFEYFDRAAEGAYKLPVRALDNRFLYSTEDLDQRSAQSLWRERYPDEEVFALPSAEELGAIAQNGLFLQEGSMEKLVELIRENEYRYYYRGSGYIEPIMEICRKLVAALHRYGRPEDALAVGEKVLDSLRWWRASDTYRSALTEIFKKEAKTLPLICLNGFSRKNCPKQLAEYRNKLEEKAAAKKAVKTAKRNAAVKAVPKRKR